MKKHFHNMLKKRLKERFNKTDLFLFDNYGMWLKEKRAAHESGFGIDYRFGGICFDVMLIYHDIEIDDFLNELGIDRGFGAPIVIGISGSEPKPCFIDPESSAMPLPETESESSILIQNVID